MLIAQCTDVWVFKNTNSHKHTLVRSHTTIPFCSRRACIIWLLLFLFFSVIVSLLHCICTNAWFNLLTVGHKQDRTKPSEWADGREKNAFDALDGWTVAQKHITSFGLDLSTMAWSRVHECQRSYHLWDWIVEEQNDWSIYCLVQFRWMTILSGTGSFPFCKISSLLSALEFFALNRILFLWLDFMSISRLLNFYLRGSVFFHCMAEIFGFCVRFVVIWWTWRWCFCFWSRHSTYSDELIDADLLKSALLRIEQMWAVCWPFCSSFFVLFSTKWQFFTALRRCAMHSFVWSSVRSRLIDGQMFIYICNIAYSSYFCSFRWH